jgi:hypothetical protein
MHVVWSLTAFRGQQVHFQNEGASTGPLRGVQLVSASTIHPQLEPTEHLIRQCLYPGPLETCIHADISVCGHNPLSVIFAVARVVDD